VAAVCGAHALYTMSGPSMGQEQEQRQTGSSLRRLSASMKPYAGGVPIQRAIVLPFTAGPPRVRRSAPGVIEFLGPPAGCSTRPKNRLMLAGAAMAALLAGSDSCRGWTLAAN